MTQFGEYPLHITQTGEGEYKVEAESQADADACAVASVFSQERYAIMEARALAYGYQLVLPSDEEVSPEPVTEQVPSTKKAG